MRHTCVILLALLLISTSHTAAAAAAAATAAAASRRFVTVDHDVRLEVLDWGGKGPPLLLLAGLGDSAHVYDAFAPRLVNSHHVLAITRRGFGASSIPSGGYGADRLADDVIEVIDALRIDRPLLAGHSIGGEELTSIGIRHPDKVAGLIYLDAGYAYAFYDVKRGDRNVDINEVRAKLDALQKAAPGPGSPLPDGRLASQLLQGDLPRLMSDLQQALAPLAGRAALPAPVTPPAFSAPFLAVLAGERRFPAVTAVPVLAIFASPHDDDTPENAAITAAHASAFEHAMPQAHVVRLAHANHYLFRSNEADVLREINAFSAALPPAR